MRSHYLAARTKSRERADKMLGQKMVSLLYSIVFEVIMGLWKDVVFRFIQRTFITLKFICKAQFSWFKSCYRETRTPWWSFEGRWLSKMNQKYLVYTKNTFCAHRSKFWTPPPPPQHWSGSLAQAAAAHWPRSVVTVTSSVKGMTSQKRGLAPVRPQPPKAPSRFPVSNNHSSPSRHHPGSTALRVSYW